MMTSSLKYSEFQQSIMNSTCLTRKIFKFRKLILFKVQLVNKTEWWLLPYNSQNSNNLFWTPQVYSWTFTMTWVSSHDIISQTLTITENIVYLSKFLVLKATENVTENNCQFISNNVFINIDIFRNIEYRNQTYFLYSLHLFFGRISANLMK